MEFIIFIFIVVIFLAQMSYYRKYEVVGTGLAYGVIENQMVFEYPIYQEVIMDGLTYKEAVTRCNKLNQM